MGTMSVFSILAIVHAITCYPSQHRYANREGQSVREVGHNAFEDSSNINSLISYRAQNDQGYYKFGYGVADGSYRVEEGSPTDGVLGTYGYIDTRGLEVKVYYKADHQGFQLLTADEYRNLRAIKTSATATSSTPDSKKHLNSNHKPVQQNPEPIQPTTTVPPPPPPPPPVPATLSGSEYHGDPSGGFYDYSDVGGEHVDGSMREVAADIGVEIPNKYGGQPHGDIRVQKWPLYRTLEALQPFPVYYFPTIHQYEALGHHYQAPYLYPFGSKRSHQTRFVIHS